ncbi:MAG: flagellar type III secretion system pore protein FliP [Oscillospiraceae bacterium]|nr:flagellar type III secretion system pore protein FliP [Oscillospiraceae bacterium]
MFKKRIKAIWLVLLMFSVCSGEVAAASFSINVNSKETGVLDILFLTTLLSLLPAIVLTMTCFTRIAIVFSFLRNAMGTAQVPPTQVLMGLSLMLTVFIMTPVVKQIETQAYIPYKKGEIEQEAAIKAAAQPLKEFMLRQTKKEDMALFMSIAKSPKIKDVKEIGIEVVIPAFIISEIKRAFVMGFCLFIPFIVIDMVVSSILMSLGMMMLPPAMISLPFKILLFILANGWDMLVKSLVTSFR